METATLIVKITEGYTAKLTQDNPIGYFDTDTHQNIIKEKEVITTIADNTGIIEFTLLKKGTSLGWGYTLEILDLEQLPIKTYKVKPQDIDGFLELVF